MSSRCGGRGGGGGRERPKKVGGCVEEVGAGGLARTKLPGVAGNLSLQEEQERTGVWRVEDVAWSVDVF